MNIYNSSSLCNLQKENMTKNASTSEKKFMKQEYYIWLTFNYQITICISHSLLLMNWNLASQSEVLRGAAVELPES